MDISCLAFSCFQDQQPTQPSGKLPFFHRWVLALARNSSWFELFNSPFPCNQIPCYSSRVVMDLTPKGASAMEWVTPQHEEIDLNCEVSSYANAEL